MVVQFSSILDGVTKKKDGTLSLKIGTQELSPEETALLFEMGNKQIWVAFSELEFQQEDIKLPEFVPEFEGEKSHSQRLREILYVAWSQSDKTKTSDQFYRDYMERLIEHVKDKLK